MHYLSRAPNYKVSRYQVIDDRGRVVLATDYKEIMRWLEDNKVLFTIGLDVIHNSVLLFLQPKEDMERFGELIAMGLLSSNKHLGGLVID